MNYHEDSILILHIDDEPGFADMTAEFLHRADDRFEVDTATSAQDGLGKLSDETYDCIVCDYDMPNMDGIEVLESVREDSPDLPFILFTGKGSEEVASEALSKGATDYLQKQTGAERYELLANSILNAVNKYRSERRTANLRRIRSLIREADRKLVQTSSKEEAARAVCEVLSESDPYKFAWIGHVDADSKEIVPYASAGFGKGYLDDITVTYDESSTGQGPGGTAIREGEIAVSQKIRDDPKFEPWRRKAIERGFESVAAVPIESNETLHGELVVYAGRSNAFDDQERALLSDLAQDMATSFDRYDAKRFAEIQRSQYQNLFEQAPVMYIATRVEENEPIIEFCNQQFSDKLGYSRQDILGRSAFDFYTGESEKRAREGGLERALNSKLFQEHRTLKTRHGEVLNTIVQATSRYDEDGTVNGVMTLFIDVTEQREREEELELYKTMVDTVPDGVYALDTDLNYIAVNDAMAELTGYSKEEIEGNHMSLMHDESAIQSARESRVELWESDDSTTKVVEHEHYTASEESVPCEVRFRALPSENGFRGTAGVVRDISDRKQREQELERYQTILEASGDAVYTLDSDGHLTFVNDAFCDLVGYEEDELVGEYVDILMDEDDIKQGEEIIHELISGEEEKRTWEMDLIDEDGRRITVENHLAILPYDDEFRGTTGIHRDITDRKERKRELERQNERLERFTDIVSHDLRNPLNVAMGRLELAREDFDSDHLKRVNRSLDHMADLIDDLLELARDGGVIEDREAVNLNDVVAETWQNIPNGDGELIADSEITLQADKDRLHQLLGNLMGNAVKHGGQNTKVIVSDLEDVKGFYVADNGSGISSNEREKVFEPGNSNDPTGTGLGLSIVEEIVNAHGWTINVTESRDGGARFDIRTKQS